MALFFEGLLHLLADLSRAVADTLRGRRGA